VDWLLLVVGAAALALFGVRDRSPVAAPRRVDAVELERSVYRQLYGDLPGLARRRTDRPQGMADAPWKASESYWRAPNGGVTSRSEGRRNGAAKEPQPEAGRSRARRLALMPPPGGGGQS
jgi:hypothetical protein